MAADPEQDALNQAIKTGVKSLFSEGDRVEFQSTADLIKASDHIARSKRKPRRLKMGRVRLACSI